MEPWPLPPDRLPGDISTHGGQGLADLLGTGFRVALTQDTLSFNQAFLGLFMAAALLVQESQIAGLDGSRRTPGGFSQVQDYFGYPSEEKKVTVRRKPLSSRLGFFPGEAYKIDGKIISLQNIVSLV